MRRLALGATILTVLWASAPPTQAGTDVQVNGDAPGTVQNEVRIAQSPTSSSNVVVAYNDDAGASSSPLGVSYSMDAGATWTDTQLGIPLHPTLGTSLSFIFDPFIDSSSTGDFYAGYIATDGTLGGPSGIYIERSADGGATWSGPTTIDFNGASTGPPPDPAYRFNDRPDMTVDASDDLYVVWIKDVGVGQPTSDIYFSKSPPPPGGLDFSGVAPGSVAPQTVNDFPNGTDKANAPDVTVASDGTVYVAWIDVDVTNPNPKPGSLLIDRSSDGGVTFGPDSVVQPISALANHLSTASGLGTGDDARSGSYPVIATDPSTPATVYMAYAADPTPAADEADIFFTRSTDGGLTWSTPIRVNDDLTTTDQIHPAMAVKPDGTIDIVWYDKRNSANDDAWDVYFAKSTDGGATFSANLRISDTTFSTPTNLPGTEPWLGEYLGLEVDGTNAYVAFTSSTGDARGNVFFDVQQNPPPSRIPQIDIKPGSDPNSINSRSGGVVPVAVLTTSTAAGDPSDFDATQVDPSTVQFGPGGAPPLHPGGHLEDVDADGDTDLVLHFRARDTGLAPGDAQACLSGQTFGGASVHGCDAVNVVR